MDGNVGELEAELTKEIRELEVETVRLDGRLEEKRRILARLKGIAGEIDGATAAQRFPIISIVGGGRKTVTMMGKHRYEVDGQRFSNPGQLLDHFDVPHYYSRRYPKKGDAAAREIIRWAKRNPSLSRQVTVVLHTGTTTDLYTATLSISP